MPPRWTREQAARIAPDAATTAPAIDDPAERLDEDLHVWDTWLLRERDGSWATVDGYRVILALTADRDLLPGSRHDVATIRAFYSRDGRSWTCGGPVFEVDRALGSRQWAGSALYDDGEVYVFYTAAGRADAEDLTYEQRIACASGGSLAVDDGVRIEGPFEHEVLFEPDGERYEREDQAEGMIYTFRDPWFFEDPATGETCLLFEANSPLTGDEGCPPEQAQFNGCVGLATSPSGDPTEWTVEDPILDGTCVNQELERPHVVARDGRYYLFVDSHAFTFAPGLDGVEGLYGFVADSLRGDYRPLNDGGLVVANPADEPYQAYSWLVYDGGDDLLATSFFNYHDLGGLDIDDVGDLPPEEQRRKFGGTLAPTLRIGVDGDRTRLLGTLDHGHLPTPGEALPAVESPLYRRSVEGGERPAGAPSGYAYATREGEEGD